MDIQIRTFNKADEIILIKKFQVFQDYLAKMDPLKNLRAGEDFDSKTYVHETLKRVKKNDGKMFVAENSKGAIVGLIAGILPQNQSKVEALEAYPQKRGSILELYVDKSYQGQGIGSRLIEVMENYFKEKGCHFFFVECFGPNKKAYDFYTKRGYGLHMLLMIKENRIA